MFDPNAMQDKAAERRECERVKLLAWNLIPEAQKVGLYLNVAQVVCGDPTCAPIDTVLTLTWQAPGLSKPLGIPKTADQVTAEDVEEVLSEPSVALEAWQAGNEFGALRFGEGQRVQCRIGDDPVTGWGSGTVVKLLYREESWPPGTHAPYQIQLDDGRLIFAPHDIDQIIRAEQ